MYTTFSVVESIPPTHQSSSSPVSFSSPQSSPFRSRPDVIQLTRTIQYIHVHAHSVQLTRSYLRSHSVHGSRRASQFTTHTTTFRPYRSADPVQYLSQTTAKILAPPFAQHTPRESFIRFSDQQVFLHS